MTLAPPCFSIPKNPRLIIHAVIFIVPSPRIRILPLPSYVLFYTLIFIGENVFYSFLVPTSNFTDTKHSKIVIYWNYTS